MERTIIVSVIDDIIGIPFECEDDLSEVELYEAAADYVMSHIDIEVI